MADWRIANDGKWREAQPSEPSYYMNALKTHLQNGMINANSTFLLAVEFGYRACEKGKSLQQALKEAQGAK
jgi:hypothetical protein